MRTSNGTYRQTPFRNLPFYLLSVGLVFLAWQTAVLWMADTPRRFLLPTPQEVLARFWKLIGNGVLLHNAGVTLLEMGLGLLAGTTLAIVLGYGVVHSRMIAYVLEPVIVTSQAVPIVALAPLLTVWFGSGLASKVVVCALVVFFPILVNVVTGLKSIDPRLRDLFRMLEAPRHKVILKLEVPATLPAFLAGLKVGGTLAGMGAVVGEFVASTQGLGYLVKQGQNLYDLPMMFVAIFTLMGIALTVYGLLSFIERRALRWSVQDTTATYSEEEQP
ncbi:MAG TPA: ABC transporter permease [Anaerolineae bacterium]|nr:ABC transporter permease [Anaerolineae bacterium]HQK12982.1 ABC transporter permease [Anaerolineae bacterium]